MTSKQNTKAIDAWQLQNIDKILIKPRKSDQLPQRIQQAVEAGLSKSRQSYIIEAVKQRLAADGIPEPAANDPEGTP